MNAAVVDYVVDAATGSLPLGEIFDVIDADGYCGRH